MSYKAITDDYKMLYICCSNYINLWMHRHWTLRLWIHLNIPEIKNFLSANCLQFDTQHHIIVNTSHTHLYTVTIVTAAINYIL